MNSIEKYRLKINGLCEKHNVAKLFVFGSILKPSFNPNSDVDFLVDFSDMDLALYADNYFNFKFSLETLLKRKVDLVERKALRNPFLKEEIENSKTQVYG